MKTSIIISGLLLLTTTPAFARENIELTNFVQKIYFEGVPYERAIHFDAAESTPQLLKMLEDPAQEQFWPNIVITLGMLGDASAIKPLIKFLEADPGEPLSRAHYIAKTGVVMALGYSIKAQENKSALDYLLASTRPGAWDKRRITWISPDHPHAGGRNEQLTTMAILGLALSGHPYARDVLVDLSRESTDKSRAAVVAEALRAHEQIAAEGLIRYYERAKKH